MSIALYAKPCHRGVVKTISSIFLFSFAGTQSLDPDAFCRAAA
jgi:hypothetical protein